MDVDMLTPSSSRQGRRGSDSAPRRNSFMEYAEGIYQFANSPLGRKAIEAGTNLYSSMGNKRKGSIPPGGKTFKKRVISVPGIAAKNENSLSTRVAKVKNRRSKKVSIRKPRKVRITRKFRAQVNKALEPSMCFGKYTEITNTQYGFGVSMGNKQVSGRFCPDQGKNDDGSACGSVLFSPVQVLDAASVLFNGKTASETTKAVVVAGTAQTDFGNNSFDPRTVKITVKNQYYAFVLRNNTKRTWIIQMYECSPKKAQNMITEKDGLSQWFEACLNTSGNAQNVTQKNINLASATPETLYAQPSDNPLFLKYWNIEKHDIILDPGQTYDHFVQGPHGVYDFAKFWKTDDSGAANFFFNIQPKFTRHIFFTARMDVVTSANGDCGRWGINSTSEKLCIEGKHYYNIGVPGQAGGTLIENGTTAGTPFVLGQHRDCYFKRSWDEGSTEAGPRIEQQTGDNNQAQDD